MDALSAELVAALVGFAFLAGFIDAVAGGGGLIQVPALFVLLPGVPPATLLGTNKAISVWGTAVATVQYARRIPLDWPLLIPAGIAAAGGGVLGARLAVHVPPQALRPAVLVLLTAVLIYTLWRKDFGSLQAPRLHGRARIVVAAAIGGGIGFYDGVFGPGTGSFLIFAFVGLLGLSFLTASASAKAVNSIANLAALLTYAASGHVLYALAAPMAAANIAGSLLGSTVALRLGSRFVRALFVTVVSLLIARLGYDLLR